MPEFMPGQTLAPLPGEGGQGGAQRIIPPLPAGIPIMPGDIKARKPAKQLSGCLVLLIVLAGLAALMAAYWFSISYSNYDRNQIDPLVTRAMVAHVPKGTRLSVTLRGGPRLLEIENADVTFKGITPTTCVWVKVLDPKTGAEDTKSNYVGLTCIEGLRYPIPR